MMANHSEGAMTESGHALNRYLGDAHSNYYLATGQPVQFSVESLVRDVPKCLSFWERELVSEMETVSRLLDQCVQTLVDHPNATTEVAALLETVPQVLVVKMLGCLLEHRRADGRWRWPLGCGVLSEPYADFTVEEIRIRETAEPQEEQAIHRLHACLLRCQTSGKENKTR